MKWEISTWEDQGCLLNATNSQDRSYSICNV